MKLVYSKTSFSKSSYTHKQWRPKPQVFQSHTQRRKMFVQDFDLLGLAKNLSSMVMYEYVLLEMLSQLFLLKPPRHSSKVKTILNHTFKSGLFWLISTTDRPTPCINKPPLLWKVVRRVVNSADILTGGKLKCYTIHSGVIPTQRLHRLISNSVIVIFFRKIR